MPTKYDPNDPILKELVPNILKLMAARLKAGGTEYGEAKWAKRTATALYEEGIEELVDYLNWRLLLMCNIIIQDEQLFSQLNQRLKVLEELEAVEVGG